ncbi:MAG TPA: DUF3617 domain-containing protein [Allosphingosinicella sp.]|jgi:hypothetical protein
MKALFALGALCLLAACSGAEETPKEQEAAASLEAGLWEASSEIIAFRSTDKTTPVVKAAVGDKSAIQACVTEADKAKPAPALFSGEDHECEYKSSYMRAGRINNSLECTRKGVTGSIPMQIEGSFNATDFEATVTTQTYLPGSGDFAMTQKVTGRRVMPSCPPDPDADVEKGKAKA